MNTTANETGPYEAAWNQFVIELRVYLGNVMEWLGNLSMGEKVIGLSFFTLVLMLMIVSAARRKRNPGSSGRQFTGALLLVIIFAFGSGWMLDTGSGSLSHLFGR